MSQKIGRDRAAMLACLGAPFGLTDVAAWSSVSNPSSTGINVNDQNVLTLSAVWTCARLISETIGTLPIGLYERTSAGKRAVPQHPLHFIISSQPNTDTISSVFWE